MNASNKKINQFLRDRIQGAQLDAQGAIGIKMPHLPKIKIEVTQGSDVCHLYANVTHLAENADESILYTMLEMNQFGRPLHNCWLALNPKTRMVSLCQNLYIPHSDAVIFNRVLDSFMLMLEKIPDKLNLQHEAAH